MMKGFYNLTSGMLTQGRRLDVVAHNMTNITSAGYKADRYTDRTFDEVMAVRVGNKDKSPYWEMGTTQSHILAPDQIYTDFEQGSLEQTDLPLDFAIWGDGFFAVQRDGAVSYTRSGSFTLDDDGYLCLSELGQVLDPEGNPIQLYTDKINADAAGNIYTEDGDYLATLGVFAFEDNGALERDDYGLFVGQGAQPTQEATIRHKWVERSNVDMVREMVNMMTAQRALQSAAQMSKIYDEVIKRVVNDIGRL